MQEDLGIEQSTTQVASSPPFFCGSPPSRATNPRVEDARFSEERLTALSALQIPSPSSSSAAAAAAAAHKGCV